MIVTEPPFFVNFNALLWRFSNTCWSLCSSVDTMNYSLKFLYSDVKLIWLYLALSLCIRIISSTDLRMSKLEWFFLNLFELIWARESISLTQKLRSLEDDSKVDDASMTESNSLQISFLIYSCVLSDFRKHYSC